MSEANVAICVKLFEDVNRRDFAPVAAAHADDVVMVVHLRDLIQSLEGKEAVMAWFGDWFQQFDRDYRFEVEEAWGTGDRVFLVAVHHGRGKTSGVPIEQRTAYVYTLHAGKVIRLEAWAGDDREAALDAIGRRRP